MIKRLLALSIAAALAGCASTDLSFKSNAERVHSDARQKADEFKTKQSRVNSVLEHDEPFIDFKDVPRAKARGDLTIKAAGTAFGPLLSTVSKNAGYSVIFTDGVDATRKVTAEFTDASLEDVARTLTMMAGYAVAVDKPSRTIMVSDLATYTFKLPATVFQQLQSSYSIGGNPVSSSGGGGQGGAGGGQGGGSSGGGSSGASMQANFVVSGKGGNTAQSVKSLIADMAGKNAEVVVSDVGLITVRANGQALRRVTDFLRNFTKDAMAQVEIEASIVEVSLQDDFEFGIDWSRILGSANILGVPGKLTLGITGTTAVTTNAPSLAATFTSMSIDSVVKALRQVTDTQVVSNPRLLAVNNSPATYFDGTQIPYLGNLTATPTAAGNSTTTQYSGSASFAIDGISFSIQPSILDSKRVQLALIPVLSSVQGFDKLDLGTSGSLTVPRQTSKQSFMPVLAESGRTIILGGLRHTSEDKQNTYGPIPFIPVGKARLAKTKEVVILMRAVILPAPDFDPLIGESV